MELRTYWDILWRRKWIIVATTLFTTLAAVIYTLLATPQYTASTTMRVATVGSGEINSRTDIDYTQRLMNTYASIITSKTVARQIRDQIALEYLPQISVELINNTELMRIVAEAPDPEVAQHVADAAANILVVQSQEIYSSSGQTTQEILQKQLEQIETELNAARGDYESELTKTPRDNALIDALNQSISLKERTYATLLDQYDQARLNEALRVNSVSVVEPATLPFGPTRPKPETNIVLGVLVGLIGGVALAFLFENLDTTLYTTEQMEAAAQLPTIGKIPSAKGDLKIARLANGHYPQLEAFRRLRTNILASSDPSETKTVVVTSSRRGEGKSTVSVNLAVTIAQSGRRVVIVDCDMRLPTVHKLLDIPNKRGLTSVLTEEVALEDAIQSCAFARLSVLTSGPLPPNPTELLGSPQMFALIDKLQKEYDFVLLDTPALLSVADAAVLAPIADNVVLIVAQATTRRGDLRTVRQQLTNVNAESIEMVINRVDEDSSTSYYGQDTAVAN